MVSLCFGEVISTRIRYTMNKSFKRKIKQKTNNAIAITDNSLLVTYSGAYLLLLI